MHRARHLDRRGCALAYSASSSAAPSSCRSPCGAHLPAVPGHRGDVVGEDRRAGPQALQALLRHRHLRRVEDVGVDRVVGQLALHVGEQLRCAPWPWSMPRLLGGQVAEGLAVVAPVVAGVGVLRVVQRLDVVDDRQVEVALEGARQPLRPFDVLDLHVDADLGQLRGDDLAALARVLRRRQGQREVQRRRHAGVLQQVAGLLPGRRGRRWSGRHSRRRSARSGCRSACPGLRARRR